MQVEGLVPLCKPNYYSRIVVRPHPNDWTPNFYSLWGGDDRVLISDPNQRDVALDLSESRVVVGCYSTVLASAHASKIPCISFNDASINEAYPMSFFRHHLDNYSESIGGVVAFLKTLIKCPRAVPDEPVGQDSYDLFRKLVSSIEVGRR